MATKETKKMTITEALVEKKRLKSRIEKATRELSLACVIVNGALPYGKTEEEIVKEQKASLQSVTDLVKLYNAISVGIVTSNATTEITIDGKEYTVAEAIVRKNEAIMERNIVQKLGSIASTIAQEYDRRTKENDAKFDEMCKGMTGKDGKLASDAQESLRKDFDKVHTVKVIDSVDVKELAKKSNDDLENFLANVDIVLSISNSTTFIEV